MKHSLIVLVIAIGTLAIDKRAHANQENVSPFINDARNSANVLTTEPLTIKNQWANSNNQPNNIQQTTKPILTVRDSECKKINPLQIVENPSLFFRECPQPNKANTPYTRPIEYLRVPKLNGGIKLPVSQF